MGCGSCGSGKNGKPGGCKGNGSCSSGGCNRLNTYDWLSNYDISEPDEYRIVEVSFKNGTRKDFYYNPPELDAITGDLVAVESDRGYNVGVISLSGELTKLQMKKKRKKEPEKYYNILRKAADSDIESLEKARSLEKNTMIKARYIARSLKLKMKIGTVEYQADRKKATFYYIADGRVDFRELIRHYASEFRVKVDMRQIGSRQESGLIGGLGSCGRELCCSTWLTNFNSVSTSAARYQNLAINQVKLSGQCGRLKCCLNYELDTYIDALQNFPKNANSLKTEAGIAKLIKKDIFKGLMFYSYKNEGFKSKLYSLNIATVKEILELNKNGEVPVTLRETVAFKKESAMEEEYDYEDVTGVIELPMEKRKKGKKRKPSSKQNKNRRNNNSNKQNTSQRQKQGAEKSKSETPSKAKNTPKGSDTNKPSQRRDSNKSGANKNSDNKK